MSEDPGSSSSWWGLGSNVTSNLTTSVGSFWSKAKETGSYVYEFTANDLNEVVTVIKEDVIAPSASALKHKLQPHAQYGSLTDTVTTMLGNVSEYLAPQQVEYLSRYGDDRIHAIQSSQDTYLLHKADEHYAEWSKTFTLDEHTHEISRLLVDNQKLRDLHTFLVPAEMSYTNFWKIYYYRTELFQLEKSRHEALLSRIHKDEAEEELKWSDEEEEENTVSGENNAIREQPLSSNSSAGCQGGEDNMKTEQLTEPNNTSAGCQVGDDITIAEQLTEPKISSVECQGGEDITITEQSTEHENTEGTVTPEKPEQVNTPEDSAETPGPEEKAEEDCGSMQSSSAIMSDITDPAKTEVSSEEGSYDVIKHKELESSEGEQVESTHSTSPNHDDEEFEKELDKMIEHINIEEPMTSDNEPDGDWEDWD